LFTDIGKNPIATETWFGGCKACPRRPQQWSWQKQPAASFGTSPGF